MKWPKDGISHRKEAEELEGLENKGSFPTHTGVAQWGLLKEEASG